MCRNQSTAERRGVEDGGGEDSNVFVWGLGFSLSCPLFRFGMFLDFFLVCIKVAICLMSVLLRFLVVSLASMFLVVRCFFPALSVMVVVVRVDSVLLRFVVCCLCVFSIVWDGMVLCLWCLIVRGCVCLRFFDF